VEALSAATIALEISNRNSRVAALQKRCDRPRAGLGLILDERGADMTDLPGGASGLLRQGLQGQEREPAGDPHRSWRGFAGRRQTNRGVLHERLSGVFGGDGPSPTHSHL